MLDANRLEDAQIAGAPRERPTRPVASMAATNSAALPSMIGISGPSISTSTLSRPRPAQADIRCSMVATEAEAPSPMTVHSSVALTLVCLAWMSCEGASSRPWRRKTIPELGAGGLEADRCGSSGMDADAGQGHGGPQGRSADQRLIPVSNPDREQRRLIGLASRGGSSSAMRPEAGKGQNPSPVCRGAAAT